MDILEHAANHIYEYIDKHGPILRQWGVSNATIAMLSTLHDGSWFSFGDLESVVRYGLGGRQGCKVGAAIFNAAYDISLLLVRQWLEQAGVAIRLRIFSEAFFSREVPRRMRGKQAPPGQPPQTVTDAAFIDDERIVTMAPTAARLRAAMDTVVVALAIVFSDFGLNINWSPGNTEGMVHVMGYGAGPMLRALTHPDGRYLHAPSAKGLPAQKLILVDRYKHMGGIVQIDRGLGVDARHKAQQALHAYGPIARRVFGSPVVCDWLKFSLLQSLILSCLLYSAHIVAPTRGYIRTLQSPDMRVLRKMCDDSRYRKPYFSDLEVRRRMQQPSIDCILRRARLRHGARLVRNRPAALFALLGDRPQANSRARGGRDRVEPLPRVDFFISDLAWLREHSCVPAFWDLPDPAVCAEPWCEQMACAEWGDRVPPIFFVGSIADPPSKCGPAPLQPFECEVCHASFATYCALASHHTSAHKKRRAFNEYVGDTSTCPVCQHVYSFFVYTSSRILPGVGVDLN
ncbi:unnamed protein product [Prorocentrum cordatum]|uniref:C2H2-type domain-containing protein n=1 Tax=Prorocentrum cordatum TaxID=2364126 RepID=A0ABN9UG53_9DINO|nr:unnamed protein product [Polarella glacialis]